MSINQPLNRDSDTELDVFIGLPGLKAQVNVSGNQRQLIRVCLKEKANFSL